MKWLIALVVPAVTLWGCYGPGRPATDPFLGRTTVPPPPTGAVPRGCAPGAQPPGVPLQPIPAPQPGAAPGMMPSYPPPAAPGMNPGYPTPMPTGNGSGYSMPPANPPSQAPPAVNPNFLPPGGFNPGGAWNSPAAPATPMPVASSPTVVGPFVPAATPISIPVSDGMAKTASGDQAGLVAARQPFNRTLQPRSRDELPGPVGQDAVGPDAWKAPAGPTSASRTIDITELPPANSSPEAKPAASSGAINPLRPASATDAPGTPGTVAAASGTEAADTSRGKPPGGG